MQLEDLVTLAREAQGVLKCDTASLIRISGLLAVKVNAIKGMSGHEKQLLVCQVLKKVLDDIEKKEVSEETSEEKKKGLLEQFAGLRKTVDDVIPASLELALAAARGKLDLRKVKMSVWVRYFSCCVRSAVTVLVSNNVISQDQAKKATDVLVSVEEKAASAANAFEKENPMHAEKQEDATQESKVQDQVKTE